MASYGVPGVYSEEVFPPPAAALLTGVPVFVGFVPRDLAGRFEAHRLGAPQPFMLWSQAQAWLRPLESRGFLAAAVRGFFENGGSLCYVLLVVVDGLAMAETALPAALESLEALEVIDLVCAPDLVWPGVAQGREGLWRMQAALLDHCDRQGDRMVILDPEPGKPDAENLDPGATVKEVIEQRGELLWRNTLWGGRNGALYYPWIQVEHGPDKFIPPCGHIAGVFARSDRRFGVHKAPANEAIEGALDVKVQVTEAQQAQLQPSGVNCLRAFPGRGIRVWGARTLSSEPDWTYVSVRRLFLSVARWIERTAVVLTFEPNDFGLWLRIDRELTAYCSSLLAQGALKGCAPSEAFYVKCDAETNPPEERAAGRVVAEIGLAPTLPNEFVVVRIIHSAAGVALAESAGAVA